MIIVFNLTPLFYFLHISYTRVKKVLILIVIENTNSWKIFLWKCIKLKVFIECKSVCNILQGHWNRKKSHVCETIMKKERKSCPSMNFLHWKNEFFISCNLSKCKCGKPACLYIKVSRVHNKYIGPKHKTLKHVCQ